MTTGRGNVLTSHSSPNHSSSTSAQSSSIIEQMYPPVCAAPVSFPSDTLLLRLVSEENDKSGTTAELSVPHTTGRKLPFFPRPAVFHPTVARLHYTRVHSLRSMADLVNSSPHHISICGSYSECIRAAGIRTANSWRAKHT